MVVSNMENHYHMFTSYWDLSGQDIYHKLQQLETEGIHYAADKAINSQYEFMFNKDFNGDILVPKNAEESISEFILSGIFQIDAWNFFMTSDGNGILIAWLVHVLNKSNCLVTFFLFNVIQTSLSL